MIDEYDFDFHFDVVLTLKAIDTIMQHQIQEHQHLISLQHVALRDFNNLEYEFNYVLL